MKELEKIEKINPVEMFKAGGIQKVIDSVRDEVQGIVPDLSTKKGRDEIKSLAFKVSKSKTLIDKMGKSLADSLNAQLKPINAERRLARDELDKLRDEIRAPLTEWEAEQARIEAEEAARVEAEKLAAEVEQAHEIGLLMNEKFDRDLEEAARIAERARIEAEEAARVAQIERDERIRQQAIKDAEKKAAEAEAAAIEREKAAQRALIVAEENAKREKAEAAARAEREKNEAIEREKAEAARKIAEQKAADEARALDRENIKSKLTAAKSSIEKLGVDAETARGIVLAIHKNQIENVKIIY